MPGPALPLRSLVIFEASARLGSFRAAADELGLTPSAVSHQVRALEAALGARLFDRIGRGVALSADGQELFEGTRDGFALLRRATDSVARRRRGGRHVEVVSVRTPPSFSSRWLLPRLPALLAEHPEIDIRVNAEGGHRRDAAGADLAIVYGDARAWRGVADPLLEETVQPLCAPALAAGVTAPRDLLARPLIATRDNTVSWRDWFRRQGVDLERAGAPALELDPPHVAIEAATKGLGVVLESDVLTWDAVAAGRLVAPLPGRTVQAASYWLLPVPEGGEGRGVAVVRAWLRASAAGYSGDRPPLA